MKNIFFILAFLFVSSSAFGQKYFKNPSGGDNKWSNAERTGLTENLLHKMQKLLLKLVIQS